MQPIVTRYFLSPKMDKAMVVLIGEILKAVLAFSAIVGTDGFTGIVRLIYDTPGYITVACICVYYCDDNHHLFIKTLQLHLSTVKTTYDAILDFETFVLVTFLN